MLRNEYEYHWTGAVEKVSQATDGKTRFLESGYDAAGNQVGVKATSAGGWSKELAIDPQYHPGGADSDPFNRVAVLEGAATKGILDGSFLGLAGKIQYGTTPAREVAYSYDGLLRLKSLVSNEGTPELNVTMSRDFVGNVLTRTGSNYSYDGLNRMVIGEAESCAYDELSNLVRRGSRTYAYQPSGERDHSQMRLAVFNDGSEHAFSYDREGNLVAVGGGFGELEYDNLGRLREVTHDAQTDKYSYDAEGLRFRREQGSEVVYSLHEGDGIVFQEKYTGGVLAESRLNLVAGGQVLGQVRKVGAGNPEYLYFGLDNLGSRRVVWNADGTVKVKFSYSAWGQFSRVGGVAGDEWLASFTGKEYDATGLIYFNARYYDPVVGRFLTEDPSRKGHSWYSYCNNNPISRTDPTGRQPVGFLNREIIGFGDLRAVEFEQVRPIGMGDLRAYEYQQARSATPVFQFPVEAGRITSLHRQLEHGSGIDIAPVERGDYGEPIRASAPGYVSMAGVNPSSPTDSTNVQISHTGRYKSIYVHLEVLPTLKVGDYVQAGAILGYMSNKGTKDPHLHYEIRRGNENLDPLMQPGLSSLPLGIVVDPSLQNSFPSESTRP